jgi:hypothetical protein
MIIMKKKILAAVISAAMALSMAVPTYAVSGTGVVDFEDGEYSSFAWMKVGEDDADNSEVSVADFNGSKQLAVKVVDATKTPKLFFDPIAIWAPEDLAKIKRITIDVTIASQDGVTPPGWNGGAIGTDGLNAAGEAAPAWGQSDYTGPEEYENPVSQTTTIERKFLLPTQMYNADMVSGQFLVMRWSNAVPAILYYDNLTAYDADGNIVPATMPGAGAAPASDGATTSASTGNTPAIVMATVMALAGGCALISRRRRARK